jgi:RNA polymerase sigma factor (sigma-70 family)
MPRIGELLASLLRRRTPDGDPLPDYVLLDRFAHTRDQAAFELLVWRHGPMVLAACRRVLRESHAAEDAFQAAFLVLARKAGTVRGSAAGWLHRVALRVCLRMKRRLPPTSLDAEPAASSTPDGVEAAERSAVLDEEVARLPEFLRLPVILCYLEGHATEQAAAQLGIPRGTVLSRLANARKRLAVRLTARGVAPLVAGVAVTDLSADAGRVVAESATRFTLGTSTPSVPVQLALEVLSMTTRRTAAVAAGVLVLVAGLGTGVGFVAAQGQGQKSTQATAPADPPKKADPAPPAADDTKKPAPADDTSVKGQLTKMLAQVDAELAKAGTDDLDGLRQRLRAAEVRRGDLIARRWTDRTAVPPELEDEMMKAEDKMAAARVAVVPADVLAEAVKLHPKVAEVQKRLTAKEDELRTSKLPKDDAGRKKLDDERVALFKDLQAARKVVGPEVEAYLRTPALVEAQKAREVVERKLRRFDMAAAFNEKELHQVENEVNDLKAKLAKLEPLAEDTAWLKEKRKRLKQELLEIELQSIGAVRVK